MSERIGECYSAFGKMYLGNDCFGGKNNIGEEKCNALGVVECKNIFTTSSFGLYYKLEIISSSSWLFQNFTFMHTLAYLLNCWTKISFDLEVNFFSG